MKLADTRLESTEAPSGQQEGDSHSKRGKARDVTRQLDVQTVASQSNGLVKSSTRTSKQSEMLETHVKQKASGEIGLRAMKQVDF